MAGFGSNRPESAIRSKSRSKRSPARPRTRRCSPPAMSAGGGGSRVPPTPWHGSACKTPVSRPPRVRSLVIPRTHTPIPKWASSGFRPRKPKPADWRSTPIASNWPTSTGRYSTARKMGSSSVHTRRGTGRVVGAAIVASHAGEMVGELSLVMANKLSLGAGPDHSLLSHAGRSLQRIADAYTRRRFTPRLANLAAKWLEWRAVTGTAMPSQLRSNEKAKEKPSGARNRLRHPCQREQAAQPRPSHLRPPSPNGSR